MEPTPADPPRPTTVAITPATATLGALGARVRLSAEVRDQNGQVMAGAAVAWTTSDASVATVDVSGSVTAVANGAASITATAGSASETAAVTVAQEVSAVVVTPAAHTLVAFGDTVRLVAEAVDANGHAVEGTEFAWMSSDTLVAVVDSVGLVEAVAEGGSVVTATASSVTGEAEVRVVSPLPTTIAVRPDTVLFNALGQTAQLAADVREQAGRVMAGVSVTWTSGDTLVAVVDSAGLVVAVGGGSTTVTARAGEVSAAVVVTVTQSARTAVVSPAEGTIAWGDTLRLAAEALDDNGHHVAGAAFSWSSSDGEVARVDETGLVEGVSEGTVKITAAAGEASGVAEITVENPDRRALVAFYEATGGSYWTNNENWLSDAPLRSWHGVTTDSDGRVVALYLWLNNLAGSIPAELGRLNRLSRLVIGYGRFDGGIPVELGNLLRLSNLQLFDSGLTGPIPRELGNLTNLIELDLGGNALSGSVPSELGNLTNLERLSLAGNALTDPIPQALFELGRLERLWLLNNESLCVPGSPAFASWLAQIRDARVRGCNAPALAALASLYEAAGGDGWTESSGWLTDRPVEEWHGVVADSLGWVTALDLAGNGLNGRLPANLGDLAGLTVLRIGGNALSGRLPLSTARLRLRELQYGDTDLCVPAEASFRAWLLAIPSRDGEIVPCAPLSEREILVAFYEATGGRDWHDNENWLTDAPLEQWHGVGVGQQGQVIRMSLGYNSLTGTIPPELGSLANLYWLNLTGNGLTGPIPSELGNLRQLNGLALGGNSLTGRIPREIGNLANLQYLWAWRNDLIGPIPPELGNLAKLSVLELGRNDLTGPIPPELGHLGSLRELYLRDNDLTGPIPSQLGGLAYLQELLLHDNDLTGPIPPSLGRLDSLAVMDLANNHLAGPVPRELGRLSSLRELAVTNNVAMAGPLPVDLAGLSRLDALLTGGTGLCAPADPGFQAWLDGVYQQRVVNCSRRAGAVAYLTQAVQSRDFPVPLVAGENALLRVFLTASRANSAGIPAARARFFANGREIHVEDIPGKSGPIPTEVDEGNLFTAAHAEIPAEVIQPGLEMVIEADPDGALDPALAVAKRIPETGRLPVNVRHMPLLDLTVVPFLWISEPDSAVLELAAGIAADPGGHELLEATRTLLPVGDLMVTAHEPVLTNNSSIFQLINEVVAIRAMEGGANHYLGMMTPSPNGAAGIARLRGRSSFAAPGTHTIAHELGHNFGLEHAPCGRPGSVDPSFPHSDGSTGSWGFDSRNVRLIHPSTPDLMSYCHPQWIGDYSFANALRFRLSEADSVGLPQPPPAAVNGLLLWGGLTSDSEPFLEPAFVVSAPPRLPQRSGDYRITGRTHHGTELFRFAFAMPKIADGDGSSGFAFVLPLRPGWEDSLASITLTGPDGSATLDEDSDVPMAILRNPRTGQVRGLLRDLPRATQVASDGAVGVGAQGLDVLFSRGLPNFEARKR